MAADGPTVTLLMEQLHSSMVQLAHLAPCKPESETGLAVFASFRKAVTQAASGHEAPPGRLVAKLEPKAVALEFLVNLHVAKAIYRRQIGAVLLILLHEETWRKALTDDTTLCARLPPDLMAILEGAGSAGAEEFEIEQATSKGTAPVTGAAVEKGEQLGQKSAAGGEEMVTKKTTRGEKARELMDMALQEMEKLCYRAHHRDDALIAFEHLYRATMWIVNSPGGEERGVLEQLEPKGLILEFLSDFYGKIRLHRARCANLCIRLDGFDKWRDSVASCEPSVQAAYGDILHGAVPDLTKRSSMIAVNLQEAADDSVSRGGIGALYVRVIAGHNLISPRPSGCSNPYVAVQMGEEMKRTDGAADTTNPRWYNSAPMVFDVSAVASELRLQVLSSDVAGDDFLGVLSVRVADMSQGPKDHFDRRRLADVAHGELEFELVYLPGAAAPSASSEERPTSWLVNRSPTETAREKTANRSATDPDRSLSMITNHCPGRLDELICPAGHPIEKKKQGVKWHQAIFRPTKCDACHEPIERQTVRWKCAYHCDYNLCNQCFADMSGGSQHENISAFTS